MDLLPSDHCNHCLPDCSATIYQASVTAAPFRRCGYKNLGTSFLCDFEKNITPPIWGKKVLDQYQAEVSEVPIYIRDKVASNLRRYADPSAAGNEVFSASNEDNPLYDAYEKDIAMVSFYFESITVFEYTRDVSMTTIQYISQMGGLLGLCLGFSFISAVEIIYWFSIRLFRNM